METKSVWEFLFQCLHAFVTFMKMQSSWVCIANSQAQSAWMGRLCKLLSSQMFYGNQVWAWACFLGCIWVALGCCHAEMSTFTTVWGCVHFGASFLQRLSLYLAAFILLSILTSSYSCLWEALLWWCHHTLHHMNDTTIWWAISGFADFVLGVQPKNVKQKISSH